MSLSEKTDQEIIQLLKEYGIKHGPIVDSTRGLYERKLKDAMSKGAKTSSSSDKTFYREEEEEVTYVHYLSPVKSEAYGDVCRRRGSNERVHDEDEDEDEDEDYDTEPRLHSTEATYQSVARSKEPIPKPSGGMSKCIQLLLLAVLAGFLYFVYLGMEPKTENPFSEHLNP